MIAAEGLTKQLGARTVVSDLTFRCEPGTLTGFLAPDGAGKTTTMRMLVGLSEPDHGEARLLAALSRPAQPSGSPSCATPRSVHARTPSSTTTTMSRCGRS